MAIVSSTFLGEGLVHDRLMLLSTALVSFDTTLGLVSKDGTKGFSMEPLRIWGTFSGEDVTELVVDEHDVVTDVVDPEVVEEDVDDKVEEVCANITDESTDPVVVITVGLTSGLG